MADSKKKKKIEEKPEETPAPAEPVEAPAEAPAESQEDKAAGLQQKLDAEHEAHLRLAAEYDNFRKRTQKEKDASYANGKADAIAKLLPVYDNLARALAQDTQDAAYKKGVEMTMTELERIFQALGVEVFGTAGDAFDPQLHNAVMHVEDENLGENVLAQVFQKGFRLGDRVIRFAMVQVAN